MKPGTGQSGKHMEYKQYRDFTPSLRNLFLKGGSFQKAAEKVQSVIGRLSLLGEDPLKGLKLTNFGENRIQKVYKYDLPGRARLITIQDNNVVLFCFAGDHIECDNWLDKHRGSRMFENSSSQIDLVRMTNANSNPEERPTGPSSLTQGKLFENIQPESYFERLIDGLPRSIVRRLEEMESIVEESVIDKVASEIDDSEKRQVIIDVFSILRQDKKAEALDRIKLFLGEVRSIEHLTEDEIEVLADGENIRKLQSDDPRFKLVFEHFVKTASYMDWMLFLHPDQQDIVNMDYSGPTKLSGVSGSGKTCIVVQRAIRLAGKYPGEKLLILTLNRQLARLIKDMVESACPKDLIGAIDVLPFFSLCQRLLNKFEPENYKLYDDVTWKSKEHVDEIWCEYYRCELNNNDAKILIPVHDSFIARGINGEQYVREEFDWIRSAVAPTKRKDYLNLERTGRSYPLSEIFRDTLLEGLLLWEKKMRNIGVTDYLGLSSALHRHLDKIDSLYRCIIADESQDFGTIELQIINKLVESGENDLFICGDIAQQVSAKHLNLGDAGIDVPSVRSLKIKKNYRNSREILLAAYDILENNLTEEMLESREFEILDPEYANFSAAPPLILKANKLEEEISFAIEYLKEYLRNDPGKKTCIAFCGYSLYQIQQFGNRIGIKVLDEEVSIDVNNLYFSDLEHTKGFEFDAVVVVNCKQGVLPDVTKPEKEQFRDLSRFYVSMTRAKDQLVVSFSDTLSPYLSVADTYFLHEDWHTYVEKHMETSFGEPLSLEDIRHREHAENELRDLIDLSGPEFLYTPYALGLSSLLIEKLRKVVSGKSLIRNRVPVEWKTLRQAKLDTDNNVRSRQAFGPEGIKQFRSLIEDLKKQQVSNKW